MASKIAAPPTSSRIYTYEKISNLTADMRKVNVIGVVRSFRPAARSRGTDYSCSLEIVDETETALKCVLFNAAIEKLPFCHDGDVICIRRGKVSSFQGRPQLQSHRFSSWVLFHKDSIRASSTNYTLTGVEELRVQQLRAWASGATPAGGSLGQASSPDTTLSASSSQSSSHTQAGTNTRAAASSSQLATSSGQSPSINRSPPESIASSTRHSPPMTRSAASQSGAISSTSAASSTSEAASLSVVLSQSSLSAPLNHSMAASSQASAPQSSESVYRGPSGVFYSASVQPASNRHSNLPLVNIGSLSPGLSKVGVCGVVQYYKPVTRSKGTDYYVTVGLMDSSSHTHALSCTLFNPSQQKLLNSVSTGQIALLKGLRTSSYQDRVQARGHEHTLFAVFSNLMDARIPDSLGNWYQLSTHEKKRILQLKVWLHSSGPLLLNTSLNQISSANFFTTVCRVASVHTCPEESLTVLEVFDGTTPRLPYKSCDTRKWVTKQDVQLVACYEALLCQVHIVDWQDQLTINPGDFVYFSNLHAKVVDDENGSQVQLTITQGVKNPVIKVVDQKNCTRVVTRFIEELPIPQGPFPVFLEPFCALPEHLFTIDDEESKQAASIVEVLGSPAGSVFVVEGQVMNIAHGPVEELCQLRCSSCRTRYVTPQPNDPGPSLNAGDVCIFCSESGLDGPRLQYTYVLTLRLKDQTGVMDICVTAEEGEKLLNAVPPTNLYTDQYSRDRLLKLLYIITGWNDPFYLATTKADYTRPIARCCVKTFISSDGKTRFTLTDTVCV